MVDSSGKNTLDTKYLIGLRFSLDLDRKCHSDDNVPHVESFSMAKVMLFCGRDGPTLHKLGECQVSTVELLRRVPWFVVVCAIALLAIGLSGIARADELNGIHLFAKQLTWALFSVPVLVITLVIPYRTWKPISHLLFIASLPLLVVVLFMEKRNGARCWIQLGFFDLQPSEIVKVTYILVLAQYLMYRDSFRRLTGLVTPFVITLVPLALILLEPDLGSALLFVPVLFAMLITVGIRGRHLVLIAVLGLLVSPLFWVKMSKEQKSRIIALFNQVDGGEVPSGDGRQQHQSKTVIALGGLWGSEFSGTKVDDPTAYQFYGSGTDFVFCFVAERWGLIGACLTLFLHLMIVTLGLRIAARTHEPFGRLIAVGIATLWGTQTIINAGMTVGLLPVIGITLPLMSAGGSSLLMSVVGLGLVLNVGARPGYEVTGEPFQFE
jgi:cell division protein FtsW (lipid II flippase)